MKFDYKVNKHSIKVTVHVPGDEQPKVLRLSLQQWWAVSVAAKWAPTAYPNACANVEMFILPRHVVIYTTMCSLERLGLVRRCVHTPAWHLDVLTKLGEAVRQAIPAPPDDWPEKAAPRKTDPTKRPLTAHQVDVLSNWPHHAHPPSALPHGASERVPGQWWRADGNRLKLGTAQSLVEKGYLEPGVLGVDIVDGRLVFVDRDNPETTVGVVYRPTVVGALMKKNGA